MTRLVKWIRKNQKGTTMVEMIVTFGLLSIFLTASVMLVANYANIQAKISGQISAENVSEMVLNTIEGELSKATELFGTGNKFIQVSEDVVFGKVIEFSNKDKYKSKMFIKDGMLEIDYFRRADIVMDSSTVVSRWYFDEKVYMGNKITQFDIEEFKIGGRVVQGVYKVKIKVENGSSSVEKSRLIEIRNAI